MYPCSAHIVTIVPHRSPLLLLLCPYIIIVMSALIMLWPLRLLYIERRSFHLYHPRIVHLCNVKEVSPSKRLNSKALIYLFYLFWAGFITFGIRALDSRVSLLQTGHREIFAITFLLRRFRRKKNPFEKKLCWTSSPNFRFCQAMFS